MQKPRPPLIHFLFLLIPLLCSAADQHEAHPGLAFEFGLIGDTPYDDEQTTNLFPNMIAELNQHKLAFVVHDGDIKSGATPCTDEILQERLKQFKTFKNPLIYVLGDNEWSDCGKVASRPLDPEERLEKLREMFTQGSTSLGQRTLALERQSDSSHFPKYRENVRWNFGNILFAGLNVPGNDNHFGTAEYKQRNPANLAWIKEAFAMAARENYRALVIIAQADPFFELPASNPKRARFNEMLKTLEQETIAWGKQVLFVHGDSHYFRIDQPLLSSVSNRRIENFTRAETYGNPDVHWLRVTVDATDQNVFTFHPQHVQKNLVNHSSAARK